jgi:sporulation protein YlmC with PRC-barrel domain
MTVPDPLRIDFHLLDRQIVDLDGYLVGKADDIELGTTEDGRPFVAAILVGHHALGRRIGGVVGRWMAAVARRLHTTGDPQPLRIPFERVAEIGSAIRLDVRHELLDTPALELWLRDHVIGRIPGASDAGE